MRESDWSSINEFAGGLAHEINNPLGFVENNIFALQIYISKFKDILNDYRDLSKECENQGILTEKVRKITEKEKKIKLEDIMSDLSQLFSETLDGIDRIAVIVKSVKEFSKVSGGDPGVEKLFNINKGLADTLVMAKNEIKHRVEVRTDFGDISPISCHPGKLNQVFLNLILNAAQAIKTIPQKRPGHIAISTFEDPAFVYCKIEDNGPGIADAIQKKIFEPFFTTKPSRGTGLGLSVCRDIIKKHGGELSFETTEGVGTTFLVRLPKQKT